MRMAETTIGHYRGEGVQPRRAPELLGGLCAFAIIAAIRRRRSYNQDAMLCSFVIERYCNLLLGGLCAFTRE